MDERGFFDDETNWKLFKINFRYFCNKADMPARDKFHLPEDAYEYLLTDDFGKLTFEEDKLKLITFEPDEKRLYNG